MRHALIAALALVAACKNEPPTPPAPPPPPAAPQPVQPPSPPATADAGTMADGGTEKHAADWKPPLSPDEDKALDKYLAFSDDGYAFALAEVSPGAGLTVVTFYAVPTGSIEKRAVLDTPAARAKVAEDLASDGFPKPGKPSTIPPGVAASIDGDKVQLTMAGHPAGAPFKPFPAGKPAKAEVLAMSPDGHTAAIRVTAAAGGGEFGPSSEIRFAKLFE